jgi:hypothetical protein
MFGAGVHELESLYRHRYRHFVRVATPGGFVFRAPPG